jgi:hypothetical protein
MFFVFLPGEDLHDWHMWTKTKQQMSKFLPHYGCRDGAKDQEIDR